MHESASVRSEKERARVRVLFRICVPKEVPAEGELTAAVILAELPLAEVFHAECLQKRLRRHLRSLHPVLKPHYMHSERERKARW